jgi:hypothetical protein
MEESKKYFEAEEDGVKNIPKEQRKLVTVSYDYSVDYLYNLINTKKVILEVPFQRKFIWKPDRCSQFIESIIMNVPIPPIYFAEEIDNSWLVIDGLQRLMSIKKYYENEYKLTNLEIIEELKGFKFKDLPPKAKSILKDGLLRINVIKQESHPDIKYDIFMRLNKGAMTLNDQELRNCLYRGKLNDLAKELSKNADFLKILGLSKPHPRFIDVEYILRYLAFSKNVTASAEAGQYYISKYNNSLRTFINDFLRDNKNITEEECKALRDRFNSVIKKSLLLFQYDDAFRNPKSGSRKVNKAIADCVMVALEKLGVEKAERERDKFKSIILSIMNSEDFSNALRKRTADRKNVNYRFTTMIKGIEDAQQL